MSSIYTVKCVILHIILYCNNKQHTICVTLTYCKRGNVGGPSIDDIHSLGKGGAGMTGEQCIETLAKSSCKEVQNRFTDYGDQL